MKFTSEAKLDVFFTLIVSVHIDDFISELELASILDNIFIEFVVKQGMWILLPGHGLHVEDILTFGLFGWDHWK